MPSEPGSLDSPPDQPDQSPPSPEGRGELPRFDFDVLRLEEFNLLWQQYEQIARNERSQPENVAKRRELYQFESVLTKAVGSKTEYYDDNVSLLRDASYDPDLADLAQSVFGQNLVYIISHLDKPGSLESNASIGAVHRFLRLTQQNGSAYPQLTLDLIRNVGDPMVDDIERTFKNGRDFDVRAAGLLLAFGTPYQQDKTRQIIDEAVQKNPTGDLVIDLLVSPCPGVSELGEQYLEKVVSPTGLSAAELLSAWRKAPGRSNSEGEYIGFYRNFDALFSLEKRVPGICRFLASNFGIHDFGRFPEELLVKQYQRSQPAERDRIREMKAEDRPRHGLILFPKSDWNGTFYDRKEVLKDFMEQLPDEFTMRVAECENSLAALHYFNTDRRYYGVPEPVYIAGHGTVDSIRFGGHLDQNMSLDRLVPIRHAVAVYQKNFDQKGAQAVSKVLPTPITVILDSCETGMEKGIAERMSQLGLRVISPPTSASVKEIVVGEADGRLTFDATYYNVDDPSLFEPGRAPQYGRPSQN